MSSVLPASLSSRLLLGLFALATFALRAEASAALTLRITPDRPDWKYAPGEPVKFHVSLPGATEGIAVRYRLGPEMMPAEERAATVPPAGLTIDGGTLPEPGFLRCVVTAELGGKTVRALATAGFAPEQIAPTQTEPRDFDAFWAAAKAELAQVPLDPRMTHLPDQSTAAIEVHHVSFQNVGVVGATFPSARTRVYGMLCVPKGPGPFPAMLRLPGATVRAYPGVRDLAAKGIITLEIGLHGIPVNLAPEVYAQLVSGVLASYPTYQLDDPRAYYYRRAYLGCVRANDFLCSLPQWDGRTLIVSGHSQGGQLTVATAVLDPRVNAIAVTFPAFCDVTGYLHGRAGGWPHMFRDEKNGHRTPAKIATTGYYDTVNFARRLRVPGFYTWGFNDETCPPTSMFAAYNTIMAPKSLYLA
ncbi:MAG: acetylxylan esterase, partial [Opitutaceae bacterium]|nr:acetylxylan esterase [Opitutaceae bacterium]